jgi:hypothetical protein
LKPLAGSAPRFSSAMVALTAPAAALRNARLGAQERQCAPQDGAEAGDGRARHPSYRRAMLARATRSRSAASASPATAAAIRWCRRISGKSVWKSLSVAAGSAAR